MGGRTASPSAAERPELSVILPCYNVSSFIEASVRLLKNYLETHTPSFELVLVNDGSVDETSKALRALAGPRVRVIDLEANSGKYGAIAAGMKAAEGAVRIFTDADIPFDVQALPYMLRLLSEEHYHVVIGDRTLRDSESSEETTRLRRLSSSSLRFLIRILNVGGIFDSQCGLKGFRADVADAIFPLLRRKRFSGDIELLYIALKYNRSIRRIPVRLRRASSTSVRVLPAVLEILECIFTLRLNWNKGYYVSKTLRRVSLQRYWDDDSSGAGAKDEASVS